MMVYVAVGVGILVVLGAGILLVKKLRAMARAKRIERELHEREKLPATPALSAAEAERIDRLKFKLNEALSTLEGSPMGPSAVKQFPWVLVMGTPGSGKTSALRSSGLSFSFISEGALHQRPTPDCNWLFTDGAIFLDTSGKYIASDEGEKEWMALLGLLKSKRPGVPIDSLVLTVSLPELLASSEEAVESLVRSFRDRIADLVKQLGIVFPVYVVFTQCDLLQGFTRFFEGAEDAERMSEWGFPLPGKAVKNELPEAAFHREYVEFYRQLCRRRISRLATGESAEHREQTFLFPLQFSLVEQRLSNFVLGLTRPNPFIENPVFKGCYFTSSLQNGTPADPVGRAIDASFGLELPEFSVGEEVDSKDYFIHHLLGKTVRAHRPLARSVVKVPSPPSFWTPARIAVAALAATIAMVVGVVAALHGPPSVKVRNIGVAVKVLEAQGVPLRSGKIALRVDAQEYVADIGESGQAHFQDVRVASSNPTGTFSFRSEGYVLDAPNQEHRLSEAIVLRVTKKRFVRDPINVFRQKVEAAVPLTDGAARFNVVIGAGPDAGGASYGYGIQRLPFAITVEENAVTLTAPLRYWIEGRAKVLGPVVTNLPHGSEAALKAGTLKCTATLDPSLPRPRPGDVRISIKPELNGPFVVRGIDFIAGVEKRYAASLEPTMKRVLTDYLLGTNSLR